MKQRVLRGSSRVEFAQDVYSTVCVSVCVCACMCLALLGGPDTNPSEGNRPLPPSRRSAAYTRQ